jgi:hypothetical protein
MVAWLPLKALPWLMRVERVVFGHWEEVTDGMVRCIYCGSTHVVCKSKKPRLKKYYDAEGNLYDISQVPMASLCAGLSVAWPLEVSQNHVPNS